jgi:hypothetical protein
MLGLAFQDRPRIRAGKMAAALRDRGWEFDVLGLMYPASYPDAYRSVTVDPYLTTASLASFVENHPAEVLLVNNEPNWPLAAVKAGARGRPVVLDVADLQSQRLDGYIDPYEQQALALADAFVFVAEEQRDWVLDLELIDAEKPYAVLANQTLAGEMIDGTAMPRLAGLVYQGGADMRGARGGWRDLSAIADALDGQLHLYGDPVDYGIVHGSETSYPLLIQRLARHDWGYVGSPVWSLAWNQTLPNKIFEYFAAGLPVIVQNAALCRPFCEAGMGVWCESEAEVAEAVRALDPAPYREAVLARRGDLALEKHAGPLADMLAELAGAGARA